MGLPYCYASLSDQFCKDYVLVCNNFYTYTNVMTIVTITFAPGPAIIKININFYSTC